MGRELYGILVSRATKTASLIRGIGQPEQLAKAWTAAQIEKESV